MLRRQVRARLHLQFREQLGARFRPQLHRQREILSDRSACNCESGVALDSTQGSSGTPPKPALRLPSLDADVPNLMRGVIRFVKYQLRVHLKDNPKLFSAFPDVELHMHQPLEIKAAQSDNDLLSYKAPWTRSQAAMSLASIDMYEAGGNVFWINPFVDGEGEKILRRRGQLLGACQHDG